MARTNNNKANSPAARRAAPEAFPPLISDEAAASSMPPPYIATATSTGNGQTAEFYHPASFPGYTVVQITTGQENQPLLPRLIRQRRRRSGGGCMGRLCSNLCGCLCLGISLLVVLGIVTGGLGVMREIFGSPSPSERWSCASGAMEVHTDREFWFPAEAPLRIESSQGINLSRVHVVRSKGSNVTVHAVVETEQNKGTVWGDRITVAATNSSAADGDSSSLVVQAQRPYWGWPFGCVRATLYIGIPADDYGSHVVLPLLHVRTASGMLTAVDVGALRVGAVDVQIHNGNANVYNATIADGEGSLVVRTTNGAIRMRDVSVSGALEMHTSNGPIAVDKVSAASVAADTSNASIRGDMVIGEAAMITTSNGAVDVDIRGTYTKQKKSVTVASSNAQVSASVAGIGGSFLARTSNSYADVMGSDSKGRLNFTLVTNAIKQGVFSLDDDRNQSMGSINLSSSNGRVSLDLLS